MPARLATVDDTSEVVRLAGVMYATMGHDTTDPAWLATAQEQFASRLGADMAAFVVDHPDRPGLAASGAGTIATRLSAPNNISAQTGYIQWVATDEDVRGRGYARSVIASLLDWYAAHDVNVIELHSTAVAEPLYRALGFRDDGPVALRRR